MYVSSTNDISCLTITLDTSHVTPPNTANHSTVFVLAKLSTVTFVTWIRLEFQKQDFLEQKHFTKSSFSGYAEIRYHAMTIALPSSNRNKRNNHVFQKKKCVRDVDTSPATECQQSCSMGLKIADNISQSDVISKEGWTNRNGRSV